MDVKDQSDLINNIFQKSDFSKNIFSSQSILIKIIGIKIIKKKFFQT